MKNNIIRFQKSDGHRHIKINNIKILDEFIQLYLPIESDGEYISDLQEAFQWEVEREVKDLLPEEEYNQCSIHIEADFCMLGERTAHDGYKILFTIVFFALVSDKNGTTIYQKSSQNYDTGFSDDDIEHTKEAIVSIIADILL